MSSVSGSVVVVVSVVERRDRAPPLPGLRGCWLTASCAASSGELVADATDATGTWAGEPESLLPEFGARGRRLMLLVLGEGLHLWKLCGGENR